MDYYDKKNIKAHETFKLSAIWIAYVIIFFTLYNINVFLFIICLIVFILNKIFKLHLMCKIFGHIDLDKPKHGIIRCSRCDAPLYRIKKY